MRSFIGITGHYFSAEWKLQHIMLACNRIRGRHTAENNVIWFDEVISDFHIAEQIKHIVTDSGSNVKKKLFFHGLDMKVMKSKIRIAAVFLKVKWIQKNRNQQVILWRVCVLNTMLVLHTRCNLLSKTE